MSNETLRAAIVQKLEQAKQALTLTPDFEIEYENRDSIDYNTRKTPFGCFELVITDTYQASFGLSTKHKRYVGTIYLMVHVKQGSGASLANKIADHFSEFLELSDFSGVRTMTAVVGQADPENGWYRLPVAVPFWSDKFA